MKMVIAKIAMKQVKKTKMSNYLKPENFNKAKCKTCMFNYNEHSVRFGKERMEEIIGYLSKFESSHICHTTNKTCYGGLELQAKLMHQMGVIKEPSVNEMISEANRILNGQ